MQGRFEDLTGQVFGRLTVIARAPNNRQGKAMWEVECSCPLHTRKIVSRRNLNGSTKGCGCLRAVKSEKQIAVSRKNTFAPGVPAMGGAAGHPKVDAILREKKITVYDPTGRFQKYGAHCRMHRDAGKFNPNCEFCLGAKL
jgi:hypothetical protein